MKLSDLQLAQRLRSDVASLRKMQAAASGYPRFDGSLVINGEDLDLPHAEVDRLLQAREVELLNRAGGLGIEVDE